MSNDITADVLLRRNTVLRRQRNAALEDNKRLRSELFEAQLKLARHAVRQFGQESPLPAFLRKQAT